jgi:hypothetical protein
MKKISDLMLDLGFKKDAPVSTQEAFIKNLLLSSEGVRAATPTEKKIVIENQQKIITLKTTREPRQLAFDLNDSELRQQPEVTYETITSRRSS